MIRKAGIWTLVISVLIIASSFTNEKDSDDKFVVVKDNVVYLLNFNESFSSSTGSDGVKISYPYGWSTSTGSDGRKIAYPYGWSTSTGSDGRKIAYPYGWSTSTGSDGRKIAYTYGWSIDNSGRRKFAEIQQTENGGLAIVFQQVENSEKIKELIEDDDMDEAYEYTLYILINENY